MIGERGIKKKAREREKNDPLSASLSESLEINANTLSVDV